VYLRKRKGLAPVVSEIVLAAAVLTIGGGIWYFSLSYCAVTADSYIDETMELMNVAIERYTVEKISATNSTNLRVWINNYGEVDIIVDIYAITSNTTITAFNQDIPSHTLKSINLDFSTTPLISGDNIQIKCYTRRQNIVYSYHTVY